MAVDYVKTGQPAPLARDLIPPKWPHFLEKVGKKQHQIYTSKKVLGQLYDQVERIDFVPAFTAPFDTRILQAYALDENILRSAREVKEEYDAHMRRIMAQQEIKTEFEVWSTFVLQHSNTSNDFKYHEQIGEISIALKDQFRLICLERAGGKDYKHIGPFAAAMYEVTAREVTAAVEECHCVQIVGGRSRPLREMTPSTMPLMSFPWLFQDVLGKIAKSNTSETVDTQFIRGEIGTKAVVSSDEIKTPQPKRGRIDPSRLDSNDYLKTSKGTTHPGEVLELFENSDGSDEYERLTEANYISSNSIGVKLSNSSTDTSVERGSSAENGLIDYSSSSSPELLARKPYNDCPHSAEVPTENKSKSATSSSSHLPGSGSPLHSQGRIGVAGLSRKEQTVAVDKVPSVESDHTMPEGSNLRLLSGLMMGLPASSDEPGDPVLISPHNEEESSVEDTSLGRRKAGNSTQLSNADASSEAEKDEKKEVPKEQEKDHDANVKAGYSSDSDSESDEVVLSVETEGGLLDQLAMIAGNDAVSEL